ncbi:hypothetical protein M413DRAFT_30649 [Hebeloma cylindrosporum]|uniref:Uncharacterized protein n=1 Tax=Hebeloma cylindrosporum TaxID=76867 RepID=A0A0C3C0A7_HEBCY|nr:hypothetical protein M413DRAFT_30649 [Hebeloma cylindrosporum h7]
MTSSTAVLAVTEDVRTAAEKEDTFPKFLGYEPSLPNSTSFRKGMNTLPSAST